MNRYRKKTRGSLSIEMMVAVGIMAALISVLAGIGSTFKKVNDQRWVRHTMLAAGQAQMDAIAVTGKPIDEAAFARLWPTVTCTVERTDGTGQWQGLEKIQLNLSAKYRQRTLKASLIRYIPASKDPKGHNIIAGGETTGKSLPHIEALKGRHKTPRSLSPLRGLKNECAHSFPGVSPPVIVSKPFGLNMRENSRFISDIPKEKGSQK